MYAFRLLTQERDALRPYLRIYVTSYLPCLKFICKIAIDL